MANRKKVSKYNFLKQTELWEKISERLNYIDQELVESVYRELIRIVVQELRHHGMVRMPDFGDFTMVYHKERVSRDVNSGLMVRLPPKKTVKFSPDYKLKEYFRSLE
jgi:nucleoid DNA-binding protein